MTNFRPLYVLVACEESQAVCLAFRALGHLAFSADFQKARYRPEFHICGDVSPLLDGATTFITQDGKRHRVPGWNLIIAHPPCTYLCKVGSVWMVQNGQIVQERFEKMLSARAFFLRCLNAPARFVAVENPLPMGRAELPKPTTFINPSDYGVKYSKKTLLWLKNLPPLMASIDYPNPKQFVRSSRGKYRSRTFPQVAEAMAVQWSAYILDELEKDKTQ